MISFLPPVHTVYEYIPGIDGTGLRRPVRLRIRSEIIRANAGRCASPRPAADPGASLGLRACDAWLVRRELVRRPGDGSVYTDGPRRSTFVRLGRAQGSAQPTVGSRANQMASTVHPAAAATRSAAATQAWAVTPSSGAAHGARRSSTNATASIVPLLEAGLSCQQLQLAQPPQIRRRSDFLPVWRPTAHATLSTGPSDRGQDSRPIRRQHQHQHHQPTILSWHHQQPHQPSWR